MKAGGKFTEWDERRISGDETSEQFFHFWSDFFPGVSYGYDMYDGYPRTEAMTLRTCCHISTKWPFRVEKTKVN